MAFQTKDAPKSFFLKDGLTPYWGKILDGVTCAACGNVLVHSKATQIRDVVVAEHDFPEGGKTTDLLHHDCLYYQKDNDEPPF